MASEDRDIEARQLVDVAENDVAAGEPPVAEIEDDPAAPDDPVREVRIDFDEAFGTVLAVRFGGGIVEDPVIELPDKERKAFRKQLRGVVRAQRRAESLGGVVHRS
jgi:hypothetical protein